MQVEGNGRPRRISVKNHPGIYYRISAKGNRIYEHDYYGTDGSRRWKSGFTLIEDAEAAREERRGRLRRGEIVEPSRLKLAEYRGVLTPLGRILGHAARKGVISSNPMLRLEVGERPAVQPREPRDLTSDEIDRYYAAHRIGTGRCSQLRSSAASGSASSRRSRGPTSTSAARSSASAGSSTGRGSASSRRPRRRSARSS
jgi:hypothetical protein